MNERTQTGTRPASSANRAVPASEHHNHQHEQAAPGIDLPLFGHVSYSSFGFLASLGVAGAVGLIEWPVAAAVGIGYELARQRRSDDR